MRQPSPNDTAFWTDCKVSLSSEQRTAIAHVNGPLLVVAGPGSGKTTVITYRAAYLTKVAGVAPTALLVVTFTKAAADSMKARTAQVAGPMVAARATFGTFHSLAYKILRQADPARRLKLLEEDEQLTLIRQLMRQVGLNTDDDTVMNAVAEISRMRATIDSLADFKPKSITQVDFKALWSAYQEAKLQRGAIDFDDLLHEAYELFIARPDMLNEYRRRYTHIMVDEFQDTNPVQWELIRLLSSPLHNLCVVGDDDQSIYGWRGASPHFLLDFPKTYPKGARVTLDINHRCPDTVVAASNRLVKENKQRFGKVIKSAKPSGLPIQLLAPADTLFEAEEIIALLKRGQVPLNDWAVIYRTNQQAHAIAQVLAREQIPYRALGGLPNLFKRWPVQDVLSYLRAATGQIAALETVINRPNRYISRAVMQEAKGMSERTGIDLLSAIGQTGLLKSWQLRPIEELMEHLRRVSTMQAPEAIGYVRKLIGYDEYIEEYATREGGSSDEMLGLLTEVERTTAHVSLVEFLAQVEAFGKRNGRTSGQDEDAVTLVTCHKAKGLEFSRVILIGATDKLMPCRGTEDMEEERRLMYVAMTRAEDRLWISAPRAYEGRETQPSPFIGEALGPGAVAFLSQAPSGAPTPPAAPAVRAVPKPAPKAKRAARGPVEAELPPVLEPGTQVYHERHGNGSIESIDATLRRVIINFGGKRLSLDLSWCLGSPQFFHVVT
jgi:DNA helicase-2/ATP-dependent DNA helicase PcrA